MARSNGKTAFLGNCGNKVLLRLDDEVIFPSGKKVFCEVARCNNKTVFLGNCASKFLLGIDDKKAFHQMAKRYSVEWPSVMAIWYSEELVPMRYCEECKGIVAIMYSADWMVISCFTVIRYNHS